MENDVLDSNPKALTNSTAVLVLGICSIVLCFCYGIPGLVCGIIALILAKKDLQLYQTNPEKYTEGSYANLKAGKICAIIGLCLSSIYAIVVIIYIAFIFMGLAGAGIFDTFMNI